MVRGVLLAYFMLNLSRSDATITWTAPLPKHGPLNPAEIISVRTTTLRLINGSSEVPLRWKFTLSGETFQQVSWRKNTRSIGRKSDSGVVTLDPAFQGHFTISASDQATLIINRVTGADDAVFVCSVQTNTKVWSDNIQVKVGVPAKLTYVSCDQTVREGSEITLSCISSGLPIPNITWTRVSENGSDSEVLHRGSIWKIAGNISRADAGAYRCTASNGYGNPDSHTFEVNVEYPAKINRRQNSTVQVGGYAALVCVSDGNPIPDITWTRDKTDEIVGSGSTLGFCSAQFQDAGWYTCSSKNSLGQDRASVYREVTGKRSSMINVTMTISNMYHHEDLEDLGSERSRSLIAIVKKAVKAAFQGDSSFESTTLVGFRQGSVIVIFVLKFKQGVTKGYAISVLKHAAERGNLGPLKVNGSSIAATERYDLKRTSTTARPTPVQVCTGCSCHYAIFIAVVVILVAINIALIIYVIWLKRGDAWEGRKERAYQEEFTEERHKETNVQMTELEPKPRETKQQESEGSLRGQYMALDEMRRSQKSAPQVSQYSPLHPSTLSWEVSSKNLEIEKVIGKGAFGQVAKGTVVGLPGRPQKTLVAVKMLKADAPMSDRKELLSELEVMKTLKPHPHVIKLLGCVTESEPLLVLIEYVPYGDLLGYLRKSRGLNDTYYKDPDIKPQTNLTSQQLIKFAWQVADGMSYLSSRSIIHRDLAARHVLIGERETCKVTDFGMARDVQQENIYERKTKMELWSPRLRDIHNRWFTVSTDGWQENCDLTPARIQDAQATTRG